MPAANPNFGTGFVDWSSYVNSNQGNINADRNKVQNYLGGLDTQAQNMPAGQNFNEMQGALQTAQGALQSPEGFQQVLSAANANYDPTGGKAPPTGQYDPFAAALEGQNATGLYNNAGNLQPKAPPPPTETPAAKPPTYPTTPDVPAGPVMKPNRDIDPDSPGYKKPGKAAKPQNSQAIPTMDQNPAPGSPQSVNWDWVNNKNKPGAY